MLNLAGVHKDILLAPYTTYKIGGPADYFFTAYSANELAQAIIDARRNGIPYFLMGTGANILIGDKGFRGLVIKNEAKKYTFIENFLQAESGAIISDLIEAAAQKGLSGLEHFAGIPSTLGGGLWQNLHFLSPDRSRTVFIEEIVENAVVLEKSDVPKRVHKEFFQFGYDYSILHEWGIIVLEATLKLTPKNPAVIKDTVKQNLSWRQGKHPPEPSCGSMFKKIDGVGAGRLIEQSGLKGFQIGGARVSEKHANFIINLGAACATDVRTLIEEIQRKVKEKTSYVLEPEIGFIGEF